MFNVSLTMLCFAEGDEEGDEAEGTQQIIARGRVLYLRALRLLQSTQLPHSLQSALCASDSRNSSHVILNCCTID